MIRAWLSKLWGKPEIPRYTKAPKVVPPSQQPIRQLIDNASSKPLYNHDPSKTIGRVSKIQPVKCGGVEFSIELEESLMRLGRAMNPTPEERAKMKQVREYKRSAFYE